MPADRAREFKLPGIHELNKDQDEALALPLEGQHLIIGGPGTGKSVVALLRARRLAKEKKSYRTLVYNHLLNHSNRHLFGNKMKFLAKTWNSWFCELYKHFFGSVPEIETDDPKEYSPIDWKRIEQQVEPLDDIKDQSDKFLVIDEGQDMPPIFYRTLAYLGFENLWWPTRTSRSKKIAVHAEISKTCWTFNQATHWN